MLYIWGDIWHRDKWSYSFFNNSRYIYDHESPYVQEFQQYVSQKNIAASDISECDEWMDYHCVLFCIIEKDGEAVYSKLNVDKFIVSAKTCMIVEKLLNINYR